MEVYSPKREEHVNAIVETLYQFFGKITHDVTSKITSPTDIPFFVLHAQIKDFFTFIEFIYSYEKQFTEHILVVGQTSEFLRRLYLFFLPYFVTLIRYGP